MQKDKDTKKKRGGARPRAGRKPGGKNAATLERDAVARAIQQQIMTKASDLVRAGLLAAFGTTFVYRIDEEVNSRGTVTSRKHVKVIDPDEIGRALDAIENDGGLDDDSEKYYYVSKNGPDYKAIQMLLDRALGKAKETVELSNPDGNLKTIIINKAMKK